MCANSVYQASLGGGRARLTFAMKFAFNLVYRGNMKQAVQPQIVDILSLIVLHRSKAISYYIWEQGLYLVLVSTGLDLTDKMFGN